MYRCTASSCALNHFRSSSYVCRMKSSSSMLTSASYITLSISFSACCSRSVFSSRYFISFSLPLTHATRLHFRRLSLTSASLMGSTLRLSTTAVTRSGSVRVYPSRLLLTPTRPRNAAIGSPIP